MNNFKEGDLVISNGFREYGITHRNAICRVVSYEKDLTEGLEVKVVGFKSGYKPNDNDLKHQDTWWVDPKSFDYAKRTNVNVL